MDRAKSMRLVRGAYTLMELLIVIIIMMTLVAITLPMAKKTMEDSKGRDASRQLSSYFAMAKVRAVQTGRACGLEFSCDTPLGDTTGLRQVTKMYLAETPPPYSGGTTATRAKICRNFSNPADLNRYFLAWTETGGTTVIDTGEMQYLLALMESPLNYGEQFLVRFDYKGDWLLCRYVNLTFPHVFQLIGAVQGNVLPPGYNDTAVHETKCRPFQILRAPRRVGMPLEMPSETCIDLSYSGLGIGITGGSTDFYQGNSTGNFYNRFIDRLTLLFSPSGGVEGYHLRHRVSGNPLAASTSYINPLATTANLYFLVGKTNKINPPLLANANPSPPSGVNFIYNMFDPEMSNLADPLSLWVSVGRTSGVVTTTENSPPVLLSNDPSELRFQDMNALGVTVDASGNALPPVKINPTQPVYLIDAGTNLYGRAKYIEMCRSLAASQQQIRGR